MIAHRIAMTVVLGATVTALSTPTIAQNTWRVSTDSAGVEGNGDSYSSWISGDGRHVAFYSEASNLVPGDTNGAGDVFVRDRLTGTTERVSVDSSGVEGDDQSLPSSISRDGRHVAFVSLATNLVPGDTNGVNDVFVHDRQSGTTTRVSVDSAGGQGNGTSVLGSISHDGRWISFQSDATNLAAGDTNASTDVFMHDRQTGLTTRVSVDSAGGQANNFSVSPSTSGDGRYVAFWSIATNLIPGDSNGKADVFLHDLQTGWTSRVSVDSSGIQGNKGSYTPSVSQDGRFVAFHSFSSNLVPGDTNGAADIFVHDQQAGTTTRVSLNSSGAEADDKSLSAAISGDGRFVSFSSQATNLVSGDTNGVEDSFRHDRQTGTTTRVSVDASGAGGNGVSTSASISADGRFVPIWSQATNLVSGDTNGFVDVFVHGPDLTLEASPRAVSAGDTLTFSTWTGKPSGLTLLAAVDVNGTPLFLKITLSNFDASGLWTLSGTVPSGLSGSSVTFMSLGITPSGKADLTNLNPVTFQ